MCLVSWSRHGFLSTRRQPGTGSRVPEATEKLGKVAAGDILRNEKTRLLLSVLYIVYRVRRKSSVALKYVEF